jgi:hypothetical protein
MPPGQDAVADDREIIAVRWLTPEGALEARRLGEISLRFPTVKNLELLGGYRHAADVLAGLAARSVPTIRPRVIQQDGAERVLLPGDLGYF